MQKRKYTFALLLMIVLLSLGVVFAGCSNECKHDYKVVNETNTCYEYKIDYQCKKCDHKKTDNLVPVKSHDINETEVSTCAEHYILSECKNCDYQSIEHKQITKQHVYNSSEVSTCVEHYILYQCQGCESNYKTQLDVVVPHTFDHYEFNRNVHDLVCGVCSQHYDQKDHKVNTYNYCTDCNHSLLETHGLKYTFTSRGTYAVSGIQSSDETELHIPMYHDQYPVDAIAANAFSNTTSIKTVYIPSNIKHIGNAAFASSGVNKVVFDKNDDDISMGQSVFSSSKELVSVSLYEGMTSVPWNCFAYCEKLKTISIPDSVETIGESAFSGCKLIDRVPVGENSKLKVIGEAAFAGCGFTKVVVPASVQVLEERAFYNNATSEIVFPQDAQIRQLGYRCFDSSLMTEFTLPDSVETFELFLSEPANIKSISVLPTNTRFVVVDGSLYSKDMTTLHYYNKEKDQVVFLDSVTAIGDGAFACHNLIKEVVIPERITTIQPYAFYRCENLKKIVLPQNMQTVPETLCNTCTNLKEVVFPENLKEIGDFSFQFCSSLTSVDLPDSLTKIGYGAFYGCSMLKQVTLPCNLEEIDTKAFVDCSEIEGVLTIPASVVFINSYAFMRCDSIEQIVFEKDSKLHAIGSYAFNGCKNLKKAELPYGLYYLGAVFANCTSLEDLFIPVTVRHAEPYIVSNCPKVTVRMDRAAQPGWPSDPEWNSDNRPVEYNQVVVTNADYDYVVIQDQAYLYKYKGNAQDVVVPSVIDGYTVIGMQDTFTNNTNVKSVVLPSTLQYFEKGVFAGCTSLKKLTTPFVGASREDSAYLYEKEPFYEINYYGSKLGYMFGLGNRWTTHLQMPAALEEIVLTEGTVVQKYAFACCPGLKKITLPDTIEKIEKAAFLECENLAVVNVPSNLEYVETNAFMYCKKLQSFDMSGMTVEVEEDAFYGCDVLNGQ